MRHIIFSSCLVYSVVTIILVAMDYWNVQQVSHYLSFDLMYGLVPSIPFFLFSVYYNKQQNPNEVEHE